MSVLGVAKDRQDLNSEEASSTTAVKAKKTKSSGKSRSRNTKDKKTETTIYKGKSSVNFTTRFRVFCRYTGAKRRVHVMIPSRGDA